MDFDFDEPHSAEYIQYTDGELKGATLTKLVEKLTHPSFFVDTAYVSSFLLTYRSFTTPRALLHMLLSRFAVPDRANFARGTVTLGGCRWMLGTRAAPFGPGVGF